MCVCVCVSELLSPKLYCGTEPSILCCRAGLAAGIRVWRDSYGAQSAWHHWGQLLGWWGSSRRHDNSSRDARGTRRRQQCALAPPSLWQRWVRVMSTVPEANHVLQSEPARADGTLQYGTCHLPRLLQGVQEQIFSGHTPTQAACPPHSCCSPAPSSTPGPCATTSPCGPTNLHLLDTSG